METAMRKITSADRHVEVTRCAKQSWPPPSIRPTTLYKVS